MLDRTDITPISNWLLFLDKRERHLPSMHCKTSGTNLAANVGYLLRQNAHHRWCFHNYQRLNQSSFWNWWQHKPVFGYKILWEMDMHTHSLYHLHFFSRDEFSQMLLIENMPAPFYTVFKCSLSICSPCPKDGNSAHLYWGYQGRGRIKKIDESPCHVPK